MGGLIRISGFVVLAGVMPFASIATEPTFPAARGARCVEPVETMRRYHFDFLDHHGHKTVTHGIRNTKHSLSGCISCHAVRNAHNEWIPVSAPGQFCAECHTYTAMRIDCFSCHSAVPETTPVNVN